MNTQFPLVTAVTAALFRAPRTFVELQRSTQADPNHLELRLAQMARRGEVVRTHLGWALPVPLKPLAEFVKPKGDGKRRCPRCYQRRDQALFERDHKTCTICLTKARAAYHRNKTKRKAS